MKDKCQNDVDVNIDRNAIEEGRAYSQFLTVTSRRWSGNSLKARETYFGSSVVPSRDLMPITPTSATPG